MLVGHVNLSPTCMSSMRLKLRKLNIEVGNGVQLLTTKNLTILIKLTLLFFMVEKVC